MLNKETSIKLDRSRIDIKPNSYVQYKKSVYKITQILNFDEVVGTNTKTKKAELLPIKDLSSIESDKNINAESISKDINNIEDEEYLEAQRRYKAILPLLEKNYQGKKLFNTQKT